MGLLKVRDGVKPVPRARMAGQDRIRVLFMVVLVGVAVVLWCFGCGGDPCSRSNDPGLMANTPALAYSLAQHMGETHAKVITRRVEA